MKRERRNDPNGRRIVVASTPLPKATPVMDQDGAPIPIHTFGDYAFSPRAPHLDEAIYTIVEAFTPPKELGLKFWVKAGYIMCTAKIDGGHANDSMLVFLRGEAPPPEGTRFAVRLLTHLFDINRSLPHMLSVWTTLTDRSLVANEAHHAIDKSHFRHGKTSSKSSTTALGILM